MVFPFRFRPDVRRARGFTLIELILVLSVGSMITLLSFQSLKRTTESNQAQIAGQELKIVGTAVDNYISARYSQISQLTNAVGDASDPGPRTCNAGTSSCVITVQTLVNEGLLPSNYSNNNSFSPTGNTAYSIVLKVSGTSPNWLVNGLVTTVPWTVGGVIRYDLLGQAMTAAGPDSGMTRASASQLDGYNGIWNEPSTTFSNITQLGELGFRAGYGSALYSVYLRRDGTLPMTGDLNMSDGIPHNIANAANISGNGRLTMNQVYSNYVNLAGNLDMTGTATVNGNVNVNGNVKVSGGVETNTFTDYGNASVYGNAWVGGSMNAARVVVPAGNNVQVGNSYYYGDGVNSAVRQSGGLYVQNQDGSAAAPISVSNMTANGSGYVGQGLTVVNGENIASGNLTMGPGAEIYSPGDTYYEAAGNLYIKPWTGNQTIIGGGGGSGQLRATGNIISQGYFIPQGGAWVGGGCSPNGAIGTDGSQALFCKNSIWSTAGASATHVTWYGLPGGVQGTWDIGWHNYCSIAQYDTYQNTVPEVFPVSGANGTGQYDWNMSTCNTGSGCDGVSYGTAFVCWDYN